MKYRLINNSLDLMLVINHAGQRPKWLITSIGMTNWADT